MVCVLVRFCTQASKCLLGLWVMVRHSLLWAPVSGGEGGKPLPVLHGAGGPACRCSGPYDPEEVVVVLVSQDGTCSRKCIGRWCDLQCAVCPNCGTGLMHEFQHCGWPHSKAHIKGHVQCFMRSLVQADINAPAFCMDIPSCMCLCVLCKGVDHR